MQSKISLIALMVFIAVSCTSDKVVKLAQRNFNDEVPLKGHLSFTFNKDMVPDSLVGKWTENAYLNIEPAVSGKTHWRSKQELAFIPSEDFKPATKYNVELNKEVFKYISLKYDGERSFHFHTPYLNMVSSRAYWNKSDEGNDYGIQVDMQFNYKVLPSEVEKLFEVTVDKTTHSFKIITSEISDKISAVISGLKREDKDYPVEIKLKEGLTPGSGGSKSTEVFVKQFDIPSPFKLNITDLQASHDGNEGGLTLYTTQEVTSEILKKYIAIEPAVKYTMDVQPGYFVLKSENFSIDAKYQITVKQGLTGKLGGELKYDFTQPVSFGKINPAIRFYDQKEFYVSGAGSRNIQVAILNVPKVSVKVWKIYENNILNYLRSNSYYYYDYEYDDYDDYGYSNYDRPGNMGDMVYEKEIETEALPRKGSNRLLTLDFEDKFAGYKGIYVIEVKSAENYNPRATKLLSISDIGLIIKKGKNSVTVFANSIKTANPMTDVTLNFIGRNNQVVKTLKTDNSGVATYNFEKEQAYGFEVTMVSAQVGNDYNVIPLDRTSVNTSRFDVGGKRQNSSGLEAFIYGDRNLYRPGETANISAIIRDYSWKTPESFPVIIEVINPSGKNYKTIKKVINEFGAFETQIAIMSSAQTGSYSVNIYTSNNVLIGASYIKVEEFMPDRIKVEAKLNKEFYKPGEIVAVSVKAENFFGPPAANRNYEVEMSTVRSWFHPKKNKDYNYSITGALNSFSNQFESGTTDAQGEVSELFSIPREYKNMGLLRSDVFVTVFDETGRPVNRVNRFNIYTQEVFFGIRSDDYWVKTGQPVKFDLIAVDKDGNELKGIEADVKLIRYEYKTVLAKSGGYFRYKSEKVEKVLEHKKLMINETSTTFGFIPDLSGSYELRVTAPGVSTYVESNLYAYGWGSTSYSSFKVNNEGQIDIETDKTNYNVGEKANVILKAPFTGKMLITIESDKVLDHFYVQTDKRAASFELEIKEEYLPNVYISATLFRPHEESDIPLTVAHGYAPVKVEKTENKLPVEITVAEKSRSNTKQTIRVKSKPNTALTIAAVDEGILQVAGYSTPDPYAFYYQKRALEVSSSNIYPYLFPETGAVRSTTGGDGGEMESKRLNPLQSNRVKLVSYWSGLLKTNNNGEAEFEIDIPQFSGDLRIMAVGYKGQVFGSAQKNMKVADPLVVSVALPRFLSPGDKITMPVILTNTTNKSVNCKATVKLEGPLATSGNKSDNISIASNTEGELVFEVDALNTLGQASITVEVSAMGETFINKTDITVRPASPLQKRSGSGVVKAGNTGQLSINIENFMPESVSGKLIVSKSPMVQFMNSLDYLVSYPYGCVEQTVSKAFPQLYFADLLNTAFSEKKASTDAVQNVQFALDRIKLMQLYNGGLTYWPGHGTETWWGSIYAAHFAIEAHKAGYEVDESFEKNVLRYLKKRLEKKEVITYYYNRDKQKIIAPKEVAYSLYVLTLAGEKPKALLNYYRSRTDQLSLDSKYLLAGAYMLAGDPEHAKEILPHAFEGEIANTQFGGSFYSYIRDEAIALNVLLETDADNPQIGVMAKHISDQLRNTRYLNTQERCFGFLAMGKMARIASQTDIKGEIKAGGKVISSFNNNTSVVKIDKKVNKDFTITTQGSGQLYYYWESEGITSDGSFLEEDSYVRIRKRMYNRNGQLITNNAFTQNDLVLIELEVTGLTGKYVENVAICDILPACFEIENPRLTTLPPGLNYPNNRTHPEYMDIRDDRINMFNWVNSNARYYYYLVRVVTAGTFVMGPASADAMYVGEYHSYSGAAKLVVSRK